MRISIKLAKYGNGESSVVLFVKRNKIDIPKGPTMLRLCATPKIVKIRPG